MKLLLERDNVDVNIPNLIGETPIGLAMSRGHAGAVELLSKPKPSLPIPAHVGEGPHCRTPFHPIPDPSSE